MEVKMSYTLEELKPGLRLYRSQKSRISSGKNKNGTPHYDNCGVEFFETKIGNIEIQDWLVQVTKAIENEGLTELYEKICSHCRECCRWLKNEEEVKFYAAEVLCRQTYTKWDDITV